MILSPQGVQWLQDEGAGQEEAGAMDSPAGADAYPQALPDRRVHDALLRQQDHEGASWPPPLTLSPTPNLALRLSCAQ